MPYLEKVICGLECCILADPDSKPNCEECPYNHKRIITNAPCANGLMAEALALLKKQEAKAAWYDSSEMLRYWHCGHCGVIITHGDKYCRMCGKAVKWE